MIFDFKAAKYLLKNFWMWGKGWVGGWEDGSSVNSVLCTSSLILLMQTHMTTSCSKCFCSQNTCLQVYVCIACILSCLVLGWCTFCIHSFTLLHFHTYQEPFQIKLYFSFTEEFHGLTFPFLGQVSASVLHMSFMTWPFHSQEGFLFQVYRRVSWPYLSSSRKDFYFSFTEEFHDLTFPFTGGFSSRAVLQPCGRAQWSTM